jgi:hypothetical protein
MDDGKFGEFAQWMSDAGLVFDIGFTEEEQSEERLSWTVFDEKIMQGLQSLPGGIQLPPRPARISFSINSTLWKLGKCSVRATRRHTGRKTLQVGSAADLYVGDWTIDNLLTEHAVANPISGPENTPVPRQLIVIGVLFYFAKYLC